MQKKLNEKKIIRLEPCFENILVCKENQTCPFIEIFVENPENITQKNLGVLAGVFDISDDSEDSSYIVNYLVSIIKKEYFSKPKRGPIESFEAALHKANLALAKLASHGNVNWIGHLNAVCLVFEKNNVHFAQTGTAKAFLLREKTMTDITEGSEPQLEPNPIKTFTEVSSGRMQSEDKIILTTDAIFEIFSFEEIKKSALRFSGQDFFRFLNTALINELEKAGVLIADINKVQEKEIVTPKIEERFLEEQQTEDYQNVFSQKTFQKKPKKKESNALPKNDPTATLPPIPETDFLKRVEEEVKKNKDGFVDQKTGHIYIREDFNLPSEKDSPHWEEKLESWKEKVTTAFSKTIKRLQDKTSSIQETLTSREPQNPKIQTDRFAKKIYFSDKLRKGSDYAKGQLQTTWREKIVPSGRKIKTSSRSGLQIFLAFVLEKIIRPAKILSEKLIQNFKNRRQKIPIRNYNSPSSFSEKFSPEFSGFKKLKEIFSNLDYAGKTYAILAILAIFVLPYFIAKLDFGKKQEESQPVAKETPLALPLENDPSVVRIETAEAINSDPEIIKIVSLKKDNFAVSKNQIRNLSSSEEFSFPDGFSSPGWSAEMEDLTLIFSIEQSGKTVSFSPISKKFQSGKINLPSESEIIAVKSYLTYLYALDPKNNQIYRYFRSDSTEGGFSEKSDWLKDKTDISGALDMAINDNIFLVNGNSLIQFFRGKKTDFSTENSTTPIHFDKVFAKNGTENIYILDKTNARVVKFSPEGKILAQYYNNDLGKAQDFSVDEEKSQIYFFNSEGTKKLQMP